MAEVVDEQFLEVGEEAEVAKVYSLVRYDVTKADIEATRAKYAALSCDTADGYEEVRLAIGFCRGTRVKIENRRKELKRASLEYGRRVDAVAKELTALIEEIEEPLKAKKLVVDNERERLRAEKEAAERAEIEAKLRAEREAEEARIRAERDAEERRLAEERAKLEAERAALAEQQRRVEEAQRFERERLDREAAELKRQREEAAARAKAEEDRIEAERERVRQEREANERAEFERQARIRAEAEAKARAEREREEAEEARRREEERQAEHARRLEAMKPDIERVRDFGRELLTLAIPDVQAPEAREILEVARQDLAAIAAELQAFGAVKAAQEGRV